MNVPPSVPLAEPVVASALARLQARIAGGMRYDLAGIRSLLAALGAPQERMRHVLVVGTNGKGSTSKLVADSLRYAGHRVGHFTSPHLFHFRERIVVDGRAIDDASLASGLQALASVEPSLARPYSFFEGATAMAAWYFARAKVDVAVWEAGLGGRLDATNAMPTAHVLAVAVTAIGLDHQQILGSSLAAIAREKAGAFRARRPAILAPQGPEAMAALRAVGEEVGAAMEVAPTSFSGLPPPALQAPFLQQNAALADAVAARLDSLGMSCPPSARRLARERFFWPGRYHWLPSLGGGAPGTHSGLRQIPWLVDGGHNPAGCAALACALRKEARLRGRQVHLVFGALRDKAAEDMLAPLRPLCASVWLAACPSLRSHGLRALLSAAPEARVAASLPRTLEHIAAGDPARDVGVVTGSLTLVAQALRCLGANLA